MMVVWIIVEVLFLILFYELPQVKEKEEEESQKSYVCSTGNASRTQASSTGLDRSGRESLETTIREEEEDKDNVLFKQPPLETIKTSGALKSSLLVNDHDQRERRILDEKAPLLPNEANRLVSSTYGGTQTTAVEAKKEEKEDLEGGQAPKLTLPEHGIRRARSYVLWLLSEFIREDIVVLLATIFVTIYNQTAIEVRIHMNLLLTEAPLCRIARSHNLSSYISVSV